MELKYITCLWDLYESDNYSGKNGWDGQIIVQENGFFEGVVINRNDKKKEQSLVLGILKNDKMEFFRIVPSQTSAPFYYNLKNGHRGFNGPFYIFYPYSVDEIGNCRVMTQNIKYHNNEEKEEKIFELDLKIENWKNNLLNDELFLKNELFSLATTNYYNHDYQAENFDQLIEDVIPDYTSSQKRFKNK